MLCGRTRAGKTWWTPSKVNEFLAIRARILAPAVLFAALAALRTAPFVGFIDREAYVVAMNLSYPHRWISFWEVVSGFGNGWFVYPLLAAAAAAFLYRRHGARDFGVVLLVAWAALANTAFKLFFRLERPVSLSPYTDLVTYTFPSGHAFNSVILFHFLPRFLEAAFGKKDEGPYMSPAFAVFGAGMVGLSRVFLGAHWLSDVFGGWLLGAVVSNVLLAAIGKKESPREEKYV